MKLRIESRCCGICRLTFGRSFPMCVCVCVSSAECVCEFVRRVNESRTRRHRRTKGDEIRDLLMAVREMPQRNCCTKFASHIDCSRHSIQHNSLNSITFMTRHAGQTGPFAMMYFDYKTTAKKNANSFSPSACVRACVSRASAIPRSCAKLMGALFAEAI